MQIDILFSVAKAYGVKKIDVLKGQSFAILTDGPDDMRWFSDNDPVLDITVTGKTASVVAAATGLSTILLIGANDGLLERISVNVVETLEPATNLGVTPGAVLPK